MPVVLEYYCQECGKKSSEDNLRMICETCGGRLRGKGGPGITGTRDNFGMRNQFKDDETGQVIDNWKTWEREGYRNPLEVTKNSTVKEKIKDKMNRVKRRA